MICQHFKRTAFIVCLLISIFIKISLAAPPMPFSDTYKQGIYDVSQFEGYPITIKLITPNKQVTLLLINSDGRLENYTILNSSKEQLINFQTHQGDTMIVVGNGEIAFTK